MGEEGSGQGRALLSDFQQPEGARRAPARGPREPFENIREPGDLGLEPRRSREESGLQERALSTLPNRRATGEDQQNPWQPQLRSRGPPLGLILKALLRRETGSVKAASWPLWGLFQESLGMSGRGLRGETDPQVPAQSLHALARRAWLWFCATWRSPRRKALCPSGRWQEVWR